MILSVLILALTLCLIISVRRNLELDDKFEELTDQVEESLDIIDGCYQRIAKVSEMPVASDDPIIQQLISDIKLTKTAILLIANKIVTFDNVEVDDEEG
ncbi:MAG TPA: hypothetical protein VIY48_13865 [Candidatus Paceibacterota bacterium]